MSRLTSFLAVTSVLTLTVAAPPEAQTQVVPLTEVAASELTGQQLINQIRAAVNGIIDNAGDELRATATSATADLNVVASTLERAFGNQVNRPLTELRRTFEVEVERGLATLITAQSFASATRSCVKRDMQGLLASLEATVSYNVSSAVPWASDRPIVTNVAQIGGSAPFGIREDQAPVLVLEGVNLAYDEECGARVRVLRIGSPSRNGAPPEIVNAWLVGADPRRATVAIDTVYETGAYEIQIELGKKRWLWGCGRPRLARTSVSVLPVPRFAVSYRIVPTCAVRPTISHMAGRIDGGVDKCDGDRHFGGNFTLPEPWRYAGHTWAEESNNRCMVTHRYAGGNVVTVQATCPEPGKIFCTGPRSWVHGSVVIQGEKDETHPGEPIEDQFPIAMTYGQTLEIHPVTPANAGCASNAGWTVSVRLIDPDGVVHDIPARTGEGPLTNAVPMGAQYHWNPTTLSLAVTTPGYACTM